MKCHVFVDFDGTIAPFDTTDLLLEQFADPRWQDIEQEWKAGLIGSRECLVRQIDLVRATPEELDGFVAGIDVDAGFRDFVSLCQDPDNRIPVTVVSDGLDRTVAAVLARAGLKLPYFANHLEWLGGDRWRLGFPHARSDCRSLAGNCKCRFADAATGVARIMVGDGRSDFCVAEQVDLVLAKGPLARHCRSRGLPHFMFQTFAEATDLFSRWIEEGISVSERREELTDE